MITADMRELKPILTKVSDEEYKAIMHEATDALDKGADEEEFFAILKRAPLSPEQANILKKGIGIQAMIEDGINLSKAVEAYGEKWLTE